MSSKRIKQRLDELFTDIKPASGPNAADQPAVEKPRHAAKPKAHPVDGQEPAPRETPPARMQPSQQDTRPLAPLPQRGENPERLSETSTLTLPFRSDSQTWNVLEVVAPPEKQAWNQEEQLLIKQVTDQLSLAIENARLFQQTQQRNIELAALNEIIGTASQSLDLNTIFTSVLERTMEIARFDGGLITMFNDSLGKLERVARIGLPGEMPADRSEGLENSLCGLVYASRNTLTIEDFRLGAPIDVRNEMKAGFLAYAGVPLESAGKTLGTLCGFRKVAGPFDEQLITLLRTVGRQVGVTIENARLFQQTQLRAEEMAALNDLGRALASRLDLNQVLDEVYRGVNRLIETPNLYIALNDPETKENVFYLNATESNEDRAITRLPENQGITGYIVRTGEHLLLRQGVEGWCREHGIPMVGEPAKSWLGVPLVLGGQTLGAMAVQSYTQFNAYDERDVQMMLAIANQATIAIQNARLFEQIQSSESRFRDVSFVSADYVWETDLNWKYTYLSERVKEVLGYTPDEMIGLSDYQLADPQEAERVSNLLLEGIASHGQAIDVENILRAKDGHFVYVSTSAVPVLDSRGTRIGFRGVDKDITERKRAETVQAALRDITDSALTAPDLGNLLRSIHQAIGTLLPAENFYIALYDDKSDLMTFPYYVDEHDDPMPPQKLGYGLTSYVIRNGKPLLATPEVFDELVKTAQLQGGGTRGVDWLGVPLRSAARTVGVLAIQTYTPEKRLTEQHRDLLSLLANQVAVAIERKQSELELRTLFTSMTDVIIVYDKEGRYVRVAPTNPSRLFRPPDDMLGKKIVDVLPQESHEPFMNAIRAALATGETIKLEYPLTIGEITYWFDASISRLNEDQVYWVARDITERRNFEETLRIKNEYLSTSAEIGRLITSTLDLDMLFKRTVNLINERFAFYHTSIFIIEETGFNAILKASTGEAGEEMLQRKHSLPVGSRSVVGTATSSGSPVVVNDTASDPIHRPNPLLPDTRAEAAIPLRIGRRIIGAIDLQATQTKAFTDDNISVLSILADQIAIAIDNARSYELVQQAIKEMRELDQLKTQFLANMSHELRTPLNSIIGFSRVILKGIDGPVTDLQEQDLNAIYNSGQHLLRLINDILDLSKIDAGKMELAFDDVNVADLLASVIPTANGLIKEKPIRLVQKIAPNIPILRADAMRIRQVLINLFSNAAKFTEEGTITIAANVENGPGGQPELVVRVTDTGPGIAQQDQGKLFQPFSQVDASPTRKTGGTGLGLSISRRLIELHGGRIDVVSDVGKGSTFFFALPLPKAGTGRAGTDGLRDERVVLAVDDDAQIIGLYERYLQPQGYQVVALTDPSQTLEHAKHLKPYAITLDIMMPGQDGWTILAALKNDPETRDIPVIICSILENEEKGFSMGASDYLVKPILEEDLINSLSRLNNGETIKTVLLIDDDPKDLRLMESFLNRSQFKTMLADSGETGWELITQSPPDAVILDLFMSNMDGFTLLEKLRTTPGLENIPVIVVSGAELTRKQKQQLHDFSQGLLQKSALSERELLARLDKALQQIKPS